MAVQILVALALLELEDELLLALELLENNSGNLGGTGLCGNGLYLI